MPTLIIGNLTPETKPEFNEAESNLKLKGNMDVINPAKEFTSLTDPDYLVRNFFEKMAVCSSIHLLPNWHEMPQARLFQHAIKALNLKCIR